MFKWTPALLYKCLYSRNILVAHESDLLLCYHPVNWHSSSLFFFYFFQQPIFCCLDIFPFLPSVTGTQMGHNIGFSSPFTRNQSRLCDLCRWWANHHVVFCQIPDSSCLFAWWYSNTPFLVCIVKASFIHHRGEGICQKGLLWSQKHSTASEIMGKEIEVRAKRASAGVRLQCWL